MLRKIIKIDENKCDGCGLCVNACHEGAIDLIDGKAKLTREHYCDGLGDCLPACPQGAISFEMREAPAYDHAAVQAAMAAKKAAQSDCSNCDGECSGGGCPGTAAKIMEVADSPISVSASISQLHTWPVQLKLAPLQGPMYENANLLIAADCSAYAYANFHQDFIRNHVVLIGCPKLDNAQYDRKLHAIIANNNIKSVKIVRMEVPCCGGLENMAKMALQNSGKFIPWSVYTISTNGKIID
jgi:NAD-dependent dihydropyrimidine dehydrogenase PreA subunit